MAQRAETREAERQAAEPGAGGRPPRRRSTRRTGEKPSQAPAEKAVRGAGRKLAAGSTLGDRAATPGERPRQPDREQREAVAEEASEAILGANPFAGIDPTGVLSSAGRLLGS